MLKKSMYYQVFRLTIAQALFQMVSVMVMTVGGLAGREISNSSGLATLPITSMLLGTAIFIFPASMWMDRIGRRNGFLIGALAGTIGGLMGALGIFYSSLILLSLGTFFIGIYQAFAQFYRFAAVEVSDTSFHSKAISFVMAGGIIAAIMGPLIGKIGGSLLQPAYTGAFLIAAVISMIALGILTGLRVPHRKPNHKEKALARPLFKIVKQPAYLVALLCSATGYGTMTLAMVATPLEMIKNYELSDITTVIQLHMLGMFLPSFFTGLLIARFGALKIAFMGVLLGIGYVIVTQTSTHFISFALALILIGISWNFLFIGGTALLTKTYSPPEKSKAQAANDMSVFAINLICSFSSGSLLYLLGWDNMNIYLLPWLLITACALIGLGIKNNKKE